MSQRLINLVCIVITLVAAVYLYVLMNQYSSTLPESQPASVEDDFIVEATRIPASKSLDGSNGAPIRNSQEQRAEMLARMHSELRDSSTDSGEAEARPE